MTELTLAFRPAPGFTGAQVLEKSDYAAFAQLPGLRLVDLSRVETKRRATDTALLRDELDLAAPLVGADIIISLVKFKRRRVDCLAAACTP